MTFRSLLLTSWILSLLGGLLAQSSREIPGRSEYYKYEQQSVSAFRAEARFTRPAPELPERQTEPEIAPISLAGYFDESRNHYIDEAANLSSLLDVHKRIGENTRTMQGYRILVYSGNSRNTALSVKSQLLAMDIDHKPYFKFDAPNFVVRLGDFMDREDAILFLREIQDQYPSGFIVPDRINKTRYRKIDEEEFDDPFAAPTEDRY